MRLIDADNFLDLFYVASAGQDKAFVVAVEMVVEDTPTIDAVEVVRCKDCRHTVHSMIYPEVLICTLTKMCGETDPDFFCANGEREVQE